MEFQIQILKFLESIRSEPLTLIVTCITMMAESLFLVAILAILYWCVDKERSKRLGWMMTVNLAANGIVKNLVRMPRPFDVGVVSPLRASTATGYSFPSGHTQTATSFWVGAMLILKTRGVIVLGTILIVLTAFSRLYLGVHWPMDVLGAIVLGLIFTYMANALIDEHGKMTKWHVLGASIVLLVCLIFKVDSDLYKSAAALWGFVIGCYLEQHYVNFETAGPMKMQVKKVVFGMVILAIIYIGFSKLLPHVKVVSMVKYALVMIWMIAGAPYAFKRFKWQPSKK